MLTILTALVALASTTAAASPIQANDHLKSAGRVDAGVLTMKLVAEVGEWRPDGPNVRTLNVAAFGEEGGPLSVPGPLIRAVEGTTVAITLRNGLTSELRVFGLCGRPAPCEPLSIAAGATRDVRFQLPPAGTYYYWASTSARTMLARPRVDSQLAGAIVVDPPGGSAPDRILVISLYGDPQPAGPCGANVGNDPAFAINGMSWPNTTRFKYARDESVRWRVINLSCDPHAMHLHGFHFTVESAGDGTVDRQYSAAERRTAVTEVIPPGRTYTMSWVPARAGNWLFHCHMVGHMTAAAAMAHADHAIETHAGMSGLVVGIEVTERADAVRAAAPTVPVRKFALALSEEPNRYGDRPGFRADIEGTDAPRVDPGPVPGPIMILRRGEPVEITVVNRMREPTAIHWHGIEIESYFDGVPGFGGARGEISPPVMPGASFVAKMTPPRAGTFIYHTHWHDEAQLAGGLYGALLVLEPGERYDPAVDHVVVIGLNGVDIDGQREPFALNGRASPSPILMRAGVPNRLRLINITPNNVALTVFLLEQFDTLRWKPLAKDGAAIPPPQSEPRPARQLIGVGETYDFEVEGSPPRNLWLEVRRGNGEWVLQAPVLIR